MAPKDASLPPRSLHSKLEDAYDALDAARERFLPLDGVLGVGVGPKEKAGKVLENRPAVTVYVAEKKPKRALSKAEKVPARFQGAPTDVVVPGHRERPQHDDFDAHWLDHGKLHALNPDPDGGLVPRVDFDLDDVAILEIDNSFLVGTNVDWVKAFQRFRQAHPDAFDFVTFYVHTASGLPGQGSWHRGVFNQTQGINYYAGSSLDQRATYGSAKLQAIHSIGFFGNYVLLQETGHMWSAFVRNRDTPGGANLYDLLIGPTGQGKFHWGRFFDNDHSPMDYDGTDWRPLGGNFYQSHGVEDDRFHFCALDLYLMGLISPGSVGPFYVIKSPSANSGTITGNRKNLTVQNVVWAEGPRNPAYPATQKEWKQAFVVLTRDARAARPFAAQVAAQRRAFTWEFFKGTRFLGKVDTTLDSVKRFPRIRSVAVASDDDRALVGWKTDLSTRGRVNYATSRAAFDRDRAHTDPFRSVSVGAFRRSHGVRLSGLSPNRKYYYEVLAETREGVFARHGVGSFHTRKTHDSCGPDIHAVSVNFSRFLRGKVTVTWRTDEPATSRVLYGTSVPPNRSRSDAYPKRSHVFFLTSLAAGKYYVAVESRDAAGNVTRDDNGGSYYRVTVPLLASALESVDLDEIAGRTAEINAALVEGDNAFALDQTRRFLLDVAGGELDRIGAEGELPEDDLEAGLAALGALVSRLDGSLEADACVNGSVDLTLRPDPLERMTCIDLPGDVVASECGQPVLSEIVARVRPSLTLERRPEAGAGCYRLHRS